MSGTAVPASKRNPRVVHVDLAHSSERDLRRALEQLTNALVGRLTASEKLTASLEDQARQRGLQLNAHHPTTHAGSSSPQHTRGYGGGGGGSPYGGLDASSSTPMVTYHNPRGAGAGAGGSGWGAAPQRSGSPASRTRHAPPRTRVQKLLIISTVRGATTDGHPLARAYAQLQQYLHMASHEPLVRWVTADGPGGVSARRVASELDWVVQDLGPGGRGVVVYVGASTSTGLDLGNGETVPRHIITDAFTSLPPTASFVFILDAGFGGTPFELPFSVVARRAPAGFEMSTGQEHTDYGPVLLITTYTDRPTAQQGAAAAAGCGAFLSAMVNVLIATPHPTFRVLAAALRDDLQMRFGATSPLPLFSSNKPFHPEAPLDLA